MAARIDAGELELRARYTHPPLPTPIVVTHPFGEERSSGPHKGVDLRAAVGTPLSSPAAGVVARRGEDDRSGQWLVVRLDDIHGGGELVFAHLSRIDVAPGARVRGGQRLGLTGESGGAKGPHLHMEDQDDGGGGETDPLEHFRPEWLGGARAGILVALVAGVVVLVAGVGGFVWWRRRRREAT